ncbi:penicillin-binding protein 1C [Sulfitobacter albidus]|uniref:peptidoglycan glycosyltransferase n=1 Tax=Sulfitobacter albidus TaxID=2829501 RepID=A0A975PML2_9RHOB|nr:penicillin-binding protein 1C [Sulfitobacter albidus]QUJ76355.1 penicillin-binding protein 1C [Sulfitobacter albidus]
MSRALLLCALALWVGAAARDGVDHWVARTVLPPLIAETSVEVSDRDGRLMRAYPVENGRLRLAVGARQVDPRFIEMLIAYEDKRFYEHAGVDLRALLRAGGQMLWHGKIVSGGSTLSMQVARLLENSGTGSAGGKLRQIRVALALERRLGKSEILALYLLHAPYGGRIEGVRAATLSWFGKEPARLTDAEAALLVALPQAPEARRPDRHPQAARVARARVLQRVGLAPDPRHAGVPRAQRSLPRAAPHLADTLRARDPARRHHRTTLDLDVQTRMQALARRAVSGQAPGVSAAIVVADHRSGEILAHVGGPAYAPEGGAGFVDMGRALRSPGSTLKPLVYALAFDRGLAHPETLINDAPVQFGVYAPQNFDGRFRGMVTARAALEQSLNIPPVLLLDAVGPAHLMAAMRRAGAQAVIPSGQPGLAVALGGVGISLRDLVQIFAGLAQGGQAVTLRSGGAEMVTPDRIVSPAAAWHVGQILSQIAPPAGRAAHGGEIAYKTGTSYGHRDAWAVGFDGAHVVGVWLGRPDGTPVPGAFGGALAAPILFEAFGRISAMRAPLAPPPPETLIVGTADLPLPLREFRSRGAGMAEDPDRPVVTFPPADATLARSGFGVPLKLARGAFPMAVLVDGRPVLTDVRSREILLDLDTPGYTRISVIDAAGRSASVRIRLD